MLKQHIQRFVFHVDPVVNTCTQCQPDEQGDLLQARSWDHNLEILIQPWRGKFVKTESSSLCSNTVLERFQDRGTKMTTTDAYEQIPETQRFSTPSLPLLLLDIYFFKFRTTQWTDGTTTSRLFPECAFLNFCKAPPINKRQSPDWDKVCHKYSKIFTLKYFSALTLFV